MKLLQMFRHPVDLVDLTPDQLFDHLGNKPLLVDVRTAGEYRGGHIEGAVSLPWGGEQRVADDWPQDTDVVLICKTGHRSQAAANTLLKLGFGRVSHLKGGMDAWKHAGKPWVH